MLSTPTGTQLAPGARVNTGFFRVLGVAPILGRDFSEGEDKASAPRTVILSYATWKERYGGRSELLGQAVTLDGTPNTIIGVLPRNFTSRPPNLPSTGPPNMTKAPVADVTGCSASPA